jgi:hypothetical protein
VAYAHNFRIDVADLHERERLWKSEEPIETYPENMPPEEIKKREDEKHKKL